MMALYIIAILAADVFFWWMIGSAIVTPRREARKRDRLNSLPTQKVYGWIKPIDVKYITHSRNTYTVDSDGKTYTHIGGGGSYTVPKECSFVLTREGEPPLYFHSMPGEMTNYDLHFGNGWAYYVTDTQEGGNYLVSFQGGTTLAEYLRRGA